MTDQLAHIVYRNISVTALMITLCLVQTVSAQDKGTGKLAIHFIHTAGGQPLSFDATTYKNAFGETYSIRKLLYYISHIALPGSKNRDTTDPYHLIRWSEEAEPVVLTMDTGHYDRIRFLLGIDSAAHCSGAQTGALDPMNGMFWTWSSGYVIFKLEGESPESTGDLNRIEHHIGGYKDGHTVSGMVELPTGQQPLIIRDQQTTELQIEVSLDKYWKNLSDIRIRENALCTKAGTQAVNISRNLPGLFSVRQIILPK